MKESWWSQDLEKRTRCILCGSINTRWSKPTGTQWWAKRALRCTDCGVLRDWGKFEETSDYKAKAVDRQRIEAVRLYLSKITRTTPLSRIIELAGKALEHINVHARGNAGGSIAFDLDIWAISEYIASKKCHEFRGMSLKEMARDIAEGVLRLCLGPRKRERQLKEELHGLVGVGAAYNPIFYLPKNASRELILEAVEEMLQNFYDSRLRFDKIHRSRLNPVVALKNTSFNHDVQSLANEIAERKFKSFKGASPQQIARAIKKEVKDYSDRS